MIPCKHCNTLNSLDSTFCKKCGTGLPADDLQEARVRLEKLVEDGVVALNQGRLEEAIAIAEAAVTSNPSMVSALSLKAACHERRGEIAEALECVERIVDLNPDSDLDKIRRNQLRSALMVSATAQRPPSRAVALLAAFSVIVMVACAGALVIQARKTPSNDAKLVADSRLPFDPSQVAKEPLQSSAPAVPPVTNQQVGGGDQVPPVQQNNRAQTEANETPQTNMPKLRLSLPDPNQSQGGTEGLVSPAPVEVPPNFNPNSQLSNTTTPVTPDGTAPGPSPEPEKPPTDQAQPKQDPGDISIVVTPGSVRKTIGGSSPVGSSGGGSSVYTRAASQNFMIGNYSAAAANYEHAIQTGGDQATLNHKLAQSYEHLGRKSDAIAAYQRAIKAADAELTAGRGNDTLKAQRDAAQAALSVLQGG
jgi:tetratricopeptide (TPR) repeat protein